MHLYLYLLVYMYIIYTQSHRHVHIYARANVCTYTNKQSNTQVAIMCIHSSMLAHGARAGYGRDFKIPGASPWLLFAPKLFSERFSQPPHNCCLSRDLSAANHSDTSIGAKLPNTRASNVPRMLDSYVYVTGGTLHKPTKPLPEARNGFVADMGTCGEFTADGRDNGVTPANVIEDQHLSCLWSGTFCQG